MLTINPDSIPDSPAPQPIPEAPAPAAATPPAESVQERPPASPTAEQPKKTIPMAWIPATLGVGLLIAVVYLGGRIVTAKAHTSPPVQPVAVAPTQKPPAPAMPTAPVLQAKADIPAPPAAAAESKPSPLSKPVVAPETKPAAAALLEKLGETKPPARSPALEDLAGLPTITPKTGERYVQIGALIPKAAHHYMGELHLDQLQPHIAPGPTPDLVRVVLGPFDDRDVLAAVQAQLDSKGISNFIRRY